MNNAVDFFSRRLVLSAPLANNPMLSLVVYGEWENYITSEQLCNYEDGTLDIEKRTGHTRFWGADGRNIPTNIDPRLFKSISIELAHLSYNFSLLGLITTSTLESCEQAADKYLS